jgi:hypothetical protein
MSELLGLAIRSALASLPEEDLELLKLSILDGLDADQLGLSFGISRDTAARRLARARDRVFESARASVRAHRGAGDPELATVVRLLRSMTDLSLRRLLDPAAPGHRAA